MSYNTAAMGRIAEELIRNGGKPDPVAEHLNAEMRAEVRAGQPWSFPAGSA